MVEATNKNILSNQCQGILNGSEGSQIAMHGCDMDNPFVIKFDKSANTLPHPKRRAYVPLKLFKIYEVAMTDWLASGGDGYDGLKGNKLKLKSDIVDVNIISNFLQHYPGRQLRVEDRFNMIPRNDDKPIALSPRIYEVADAIAGSLSGMFAFVLIYPLFILQNEKILSFVPGRSNWLAYYLKTFTKMFLERHYICMILISLVGVGMSNFTFFFVFNTLMPGDDHRTELDVTVCSTIGGLLSTILTQPIWVVVMKMQGHGITDKSITNVIYNIYITGWIGFYYGTLPSLALAVYPILRQVLYTTSIDNTTFIPRNERLVVCSAFAAYCATIITYPLQVIRVRQQANLQTISSTNASNDKYRRWYHSVLLLCSKYYAGMSIKLISSIITSIVLYVGKDCLLKLFIAICQYLSRSNVVDFSYLLFE